MPAVFVERILLSILLVEIFEACIVLEEAVLWLLGFFGVFFLFFCSLEKKDIFKTCYDVLPV